ncbi:MAG: solute carrier organic anion transporter [Candidatus Aminicenantes bacterium]|nr:solute carrier organic anion transporter [Candidatus Aminicenantes bacterium]
MKKGWLWVLAVLITLTAAVYQRMTGPTYPFRAKARIGASDISARLPRSAENVKDREVSVRVPDATADGYVEYKRFKTDDPFTRVEMTREGDKLVAFLPKQPPAGKLAYRVVLASLGEMTSLTGENPIVIRFKGPVSMIIQLPHILIMFLAMLFSTAAGLFALGKRHNPRKLAVWTAVLLFLGGFILGPMMQQSAFGKLWTGFPFGTDMTDNKTLVAMLAWVAALIAGRKGRPARGWILAASVVLLAVYSIPHSLFGSELDYAKLPK